MCWRSTSRIDKEEMVATEDIPVYKVVLKDGENKYRSFITGYEYNDGMECKTEMGPVPEPDGSISIGKGFHSYSKEVTDIVWISKGAFSVNGGFDKCCYYVPMLAYYWLNGRPSVKLDCVIPKGSRYFLNDNGEYVSDRLKVLTGTEIKPLGT